ncbi:MAG: DMT family protein [Bacteroidales bacterium]|nr:DMT family protein [Bacteroidales bacterium]
MKPVLLTVLLLIVSNIFMTLAWYGHLKLQQTGVSSNWPLYLVVLFSWGIALIEYSFMVPANRIGFAGNGGPFSLVQLKVMQECITLVVFTIFTMIAFKGTHIGWNHIVAFLLIVAAVYLVFMEPAK